MEYKLLEANGVEIENIDGAAFNNFCASYRDGIIAGVLNECTIYRTSSTTLEIATGELLIQGFRVKILSPYSVSASASASDINYHLVARITLTSDRTVSFEIVNRLIASEIQNSLFNTESGIYEVEIAKYSTNSSGISSVKRSLEIMSTSVDKNTLSRLTTVETTLNQLKASVDESLSALYKINRGGFE